ncbi:class I SAM-dependent methyltransferase [Anaerosacchariphilus polymeriproducens]|uniref:Class I SAM-dependent methyltransferase n=1 Tax=Anaerosacchariphilus polymeriproducens TaxID=1812858 RepID=A0A371AZY2_9FIRM|nr:class I SAM-dependent methyltransferase [Anaerosacchariphilus polymeriproducens]RDU25121.1 class I SAM-dependent methyltransferase [Anaerosacchariphilus polymeriproducens]
MELLEELKSKWQSDCKDKKAAVEMWDTISEQYKNYEMPDEGNILLKIIEKENMIDSNSKVLDIGCGVGQYSASLSQKVSEVTGVDLSPKMIEYGKQNLEKMGIKNVNLFCCDWSEYDISKNEFENKFDLVLAVMTPAIGDSSTFEKMIKSSKKHGIMFKHSRRTDEISNDIMKMMNVDTKVLSRDENVLYAFGMLWLMGYQPKIEYNDQQWNIKRNYDEACEIYVNRARTFTTLTQEKEEKIRQFLESKNQNGFIHDTIRTTIAVIYW